MPTTPWRRAPAALLAAVLLAVALATAGSATAEPAAPVQATCDDCPSLWAMWRPPVAH